MRASFRLSVSPSTDRIFLERFYLSSSNWEGAGKASGGIFHAGVSQFGDLTLPPPHPRPGAPLCLRKSEPGSFNSGRDARSENSQGKAGLDGAKPPPDVALLPQRRWKRPWAQLLPSKQLENFREAHPTALEAGLSPSWKWRESTAPSWTPALSPGLAGDAFPGFGDSQIIPCHPFAIVGAGMGLSGTGIDPLDDPNHAGQAGPLQLLGELV